MDYRKLAERLGLTAVSSFLAVELANPAGLYDVSVLKAAGTAALAAVATTIFHLVQAQLAKSSVDPQA